MPKVLLDLTVLRTTSRLRGIGRYVGDLARGLSELLVHHRELQVQGLTELSWTRPPRFSDELVEAAARLVAPETPVLYHKHWAFLQRARLRAATRQARPALVHLGHPNATPLGELGCPRVITCHDLIPLRFPEHYVDVNDGFRVGRRLLDHRRFHSAEHIIAVSHATADDLTRLLGVAPAKISVVHNGVDLTRFSPEPQSSDDAVLARRGLGGRAYALYVGAADWRKNTLGMFQGLAAARRRAPEADLLLAWAGRLDEPTCARLREEAARCGVRGALTLLDWVSDEELGALYRGAVAQVFVSRAEGFGYPVAEAMSAGCPVITSNQSSTLEIAGDAAWLVDPERPEALGEALASLAEDAGERRRLRARGLERVQGFSVRRMAEGTLDVYRRLLHK